MLCLDKAQAQQERDYKSLKEKMLMLIWNKTGFFKCQRPSIKLERRLEGKFTGQT
jgi:hypothetical protein